MCGLWNTMYIRTCIVWNKYWVCLVRIQETASNFMPFKNQNKTPIKTITIKDPAVPHFQGDAINFLLMPNVFIYIEN